jgi:DNA repair exonuclease SbcCD nuclease subunit
MFFDKLEERGIKVFMIAGNHDTYFKNTNDVNSPELLLAEYTNIVLINKAADIIVHDTPVCFVPWICPDNYQESLETINNSNSELCMGHFEIAGFAMYRGMESHEGLSKDLFKKFDMVFSGHYHHRSDDNHIYYLGNPYELTWQDYNDPRGFHLFDLQTRQLEFIRNPNTMFQRVEYDDSLIDPSVESYEHLKNKYVKIIVVNKNDFYKFDKFITKVYDSDPYEVKIIEDFSEFNDGEIDTNINLEDTLDVLSNYIDSIETDLDKDRVKTFMKSLYTEAINLEVE